MTRFLHIDETQRPVIVLTVSGVMDDSEFDRYFQSMVEHLARRRRFAYVHCYDYSDKPRRERLMRQVEFVRTHRQALQEHCAGLAFVFASPIFRFAMSSFLLLQPLPMPYQVSASKAEALEWAKRQAALPATIKPKAG